jgi:hypothetical protein
MPYSAACTLVNVCVHCACRLPTKVNQALVSSLAPSSSKAAALKAAQKLAAVYQYNKCTPDVWQHLVDTVQQQGSLAGMLRLKTGLLVHSGYRLAAPADGCDLEHIGLTSATAPQLVAQLVQQVHDGGQQLLGRLHRHCQPNECSATATAAAAAATTKCHRLHRHRQPNECSTAAAAAAVLLPQIPALQQLPVPSTAAAAAAAASLVGRSSC